MIGKVALMNACSCRGALAKTFSFVPAFDPVKESTSNSSTNGVVTSNGRVRQLPGSPAGPRYQFPPPMPTLYGCSSQADYGIFYTVVPYLRLWFHSHGVRCWDFVSFLNQCSPRNCLVKPPTAKAACTKSVRKCKRERGWDRIITHGYATTGAPKVTGRSHLHGFH
jgi:hypothetical protein